MSHPNPANLTGLDYDREAAALPAFPFPIIDVHSHIHGAKAAEVYARAARLYGVGLTYSMTPFGQLDSVRRVLGDKVRFIAMAGFSAGDLLHAHGAGFMKQLETYHRKGARVVKFWAAPRGIGLGKRIGRPDFMRLNAPHRIETMKLAQQMGMIFMAHVGDPDTWFDTKYKNASLYGTKKSQYEPFEDVLSRFQVPWIGAHMGGWPEDLEFLSDLLTRYPHLYLDSSATKWMVRELSKHSVSDFRNFMERWRGRILFGSDIVTSDHHLKSYTGWLSRGSMAGSPEAAFELYASRYWALRTLFETAYDGPSPIADPDVHMAPVLKGRGLSQDVLRSLYHDAAQDLLEPLYKLDLER